MSEKKEEQKEEKSAPKKSGKKPSGKEKTVYTHGKVFKMPLEKELQEWLREKYPEEYK